MRLAIFSDVHGNLEALQSFITDAAGRRVDRYVCLGDTVGYGPDPEHCLEQIRGLPDLDMVLGNHDAAATWRSSPYSMNDMARQALFRTMEILSERSRRFLSALRYVITRDDLSFSHATPDRPETWTYLEDRATAQQVFSRTASRYSFIGHTHRPLVVIRHNRFRITLAKPDGRPVALEADKRFIINCGSVGQPRDGNPDACYCVYDTAARRLDFHRIGYDRDTTMAKIRAAGLPDYLARRLQDGR